MLKTVSLLKPPPGARVLDLGGSELVWNLFDHDYQVTLVNLPGFNPPVSDTGRFDRIEADACNLRDVFADMSFDAVFSNSTIEHVGDELRQERFATEVRRLAPRYWVQTPSSRFPIEIHTGVPFYWNLPHASRQAMIRRWSRTLPAWSEMIAETRVLTRSRMKHLFPDASPYIETALGLEKSYSFYRCAAPPNDPNSSDSGGLPLSAMD